jgi:sulfite exporter TauE/SafE
MFMQVFISGFILGSISSFHCVGMCGPLALSLPLGGYSPLKKIYGVLLYNIGRVVTYSLLGLLFGFMGRQIFIAGFQQWFSMLIGVFIIACFILGSIRKVSSFRPANQFYIKVQSLVAGFLRYRHLGGFFLTGLANGLLPCGMVYLAITGALAASNSWSGMEFMAAYGLGTMPALLMLSFAGMVISIRSRNLIRKLSPYAFLLMGVLLILRGLNLGISYLSPFFSTNPAAVDCH